MVPVTEIANLLGATLHGDSTLLVRRPAHPAAAGPDDLALAMQPELLSLLPDSAAKCALVATGLQPPEGSVAAWLEVGRPRLAMARVTQRFAPVSEAQPGVHPLALIEAGAEISPEASIGPFCHIRRGARVGAGSRLDSHVTLGEGAEIGRDCHIASGVRIGWGCRIGDGCIVHFNAAIGADGFSFVTAERGNVDAARDGGAVESQTGGLLRIYSLGTVRIGNNVEIGANTCIDRGTVADTSVGDGTKIDDLVMIGHNVQVGSNTMLCGQVGLAGSVKVGDRCVLAGKVGIADHVSIGDDVVVGGGSLVGSNIGSRNVFMGSPALQRDAYYEQYRYQRKLKGLYADVAALKQRARDGQ